MASGSEYARDGGIGGSLPDGDVVQQPLNDRVARLARGLGVVVDDHPVTEYRTGDGLDVLDRHARPTGERRLRLGSEDQGLAGPRPRAPGDPIADVLRPAGVGPSGRAD